MCLCVADWNTNTAKCNDKNIDEISEAGGTGRCYTDAETSSKEIFDKCSTMRTEIAVENLGRQLGFWTDTMSLLGQFSNPYVAGVEVCVLWRNRNVLEVSVHVDNLLAICSVRKIKVHVNENSRDKAWCSCPQDGRW